MSALGAIHDLDADFITSSVASESCGSTGMLLAQGLRLEKDLFRAFRTQKSRGERSVGLGSCPCSGTASSTKGRDEFSSPNRSRLDRRDRARALKPFPNSRHTILFVGHGESSVRARRQS